MRLVILAFVGVMLAPLGVENAHAQSRQFGNSRPNPMAFARFRNQVTRPPPRREFQRPQFQRQLSQQMQQRRQQQFAGQQALRQQQRQQKLQLQSQRQQQQQQRQQLSLSRQQARQQQERDRAEAVRRQKSEARGTASSPQRRDSPPAVTAAGLKLDQNRPATQREIAQLAAKTNQVCVGPNAASAWCRASQKFVADSRKHQDDMAAWEKLKTKIEQDNREKDRKRDAAEKAVSAGVKIPQ